jgi:hypothetical protein
MKTFFTYSPDHLIANALGKVSHFVGNLLREQATLSDRTHHPRTVEVNGEVYHCSCRKAVRHGLPCRHILSCATMHAAVDWPSHELAVKTSQLPQTFMVKFLHRWLPVGRQTHRYDDKQYRSRCPSCPDEDEGFIHFLTYPERKEWHKKLKDALRQCMDGNNTDPTLSDTLIDGLYHFLRSTKQPVPTFPRFAPLFAQQTSIGWSQLLFGRWSSEWTGQHTTT